VNPVRAAARLLVSPEAPEKALAPLRRAGLAIVRGDGADG